jgi:cytoskeletal protein CcmA (bactofilin family)
MGKDRQEKGITTILGPETRVEGSIDFQGTIRLDGKVKGRISTADGTVIIGEKAQICADISVDVARIMGEVIGTVEARERIEILKPGKVEGDLRSPVVAIDAGVSFNGTCEMKPRSIQVPDPARAPEKNKPS